MEGNTEYRFFNNCLKCNLPSLPDVHHLQRLAVGHLSGEATNDNNIKELILRREWKTTENGKIYGGLDKAPRQFAEKVYGFIK